MLTRFHNVFLWIMNVFLFGGFTDSQAGYIRLSAPGKNVVSGDAAAIRAAAGITATGSSIVTANDAAGAQDAIGMSATGKNVATAADQAAARTAIGAGTGDASYLGVLEKSDNYTHDGDEDNNKLIKFVLAANKTITLPAPAGYSPGQRLCGIKHESGAYTLTIARNNNANKIDGATSDGVLYETQSVDVVCNAASDGWNLVA